MKMLRRIVYVLFALAVAVVVTIVAIVMAADTEDVRGILSDQVEAATGRKLTIEGDLGFAVSLVPTIHAEHVTLANAAWGSRPEMVRLDRLETTLELWPLLTGELRIARFILVKPDILLETDARGRGNWVFEAAAPAEGGTSSGGGALPILRHLRIDSGRIAYRDGRSGETAEAFVDSLTIEDRGAEEGATLEFAGRARGADFEVSGSFDSVQRLLSKPGAFAFDLETKALEMTAALGGRVLDPLGNPSLDLEVSVAGNSLDRTARAALALAPGVAAPEIPALGAFRASAQVSGPVAKPSLGKLRARVEAPGGIVVEGQGRISDPLGLAGYDLAFSLTGKDTAAAAALAGMRLEPGADFSIAAKLTDEGTAIHARDIDARVGRSALTGSATVEGLIGGARPKISAELKAPLVDVDQLVSLFPAQKPQTSPAAKGTPAAGASGQDRIFPDDPLPLDALKAFDANADISAGKIVFGGMELGETRIGLRLANGVLRADPLQSIVAGGRLAGTVDLDGSGATPAFKTNLAIDGADLGVLLRDLADSDLVAGRMRAKTSLAARGGSVRALMANLDGHTELIVDKGQIKGGYVDLLATDLAKEILPWAKDRGDSKVNCLVSRFDIAAGEAKSTGFVFDTAKMIMTGGGIVNLRDETIAMRFDPRPKQASLVSLAVPINVGGTFAHPTALPSKTAMAKGIAGLALGAINPLSLLLTFGSTGAADGDACLAALDETKKQPQAPKSAPEKLLAPVENTVKGVGEGIDKALKSLFGGGK